MALQRNRVVALKLLILDIENRLDALERLSPSCDRLDLPVSKQDTALICHFDDPGSQHHVQASLLFTLSLLTQDEIIYAYMHCGGQVVDSRTETRLAKEFLDKGIISYLFKRVPEHYYQEDLEYRRNCLQAASIHHLCKSLLCENPKLPEHGPQEFRYYLVIVQVIALLTQNECMMYCICVSLCLLCLIHRARFALSHARFRLSYCMTEENPCLDPAAVCCKDAW